MRFLVVDDEPIMLEELTEKIRNIRPGADILGFTKPREALAGMEHQTADVAFLDIQMGSMSGLELAERLKRLHPDLHIIFVTGYQKYAVQAFRLHATGYLLKPASEEDLERELTFLYGDRPAGRVRVQTFGGFEIFVDGAPVKFGRAKSRELLAYLIDRKGASVNTAEACAVLFEDGANTPSNKSYYRTLIKDLRISLAEAGVEDILMRGFNSLAVVSEKLDCDYYRFLHGDAEAVNRYRGDYLPQYSWAEFRNGELSE